MIGSTFGLRLLTKPSVQAAVLSVVAIVMVVFRSLQFVHLTTLPQWGYDLSFYWAAANHLLHGEPIYSAAQLAGPYAPQGQDGFLYPPPFAALSIPLVWLIPAGAASAEWLWSAIGVAIVVAVTLALIRSERLEERFHVLRGRGRWLLAIGAVTFPPVIGELSIGNVHLVLLGLFALAWLGIRRGDRRGDWMTGLGLGVAAVIKVFPAVLLLWLLASGRYRAAAATVVAGAAVVLMTLPITGIGPWIQYPTVLANLAAVSDATDTISPTTWLAPAFGFDVARWLVTAAGLILLVVSAIQNGRQPVPAIGFSSAVLVSVLIAPNVFHHYLAIVILPILLALGAGVSLRWIAVSYLLMSGGRQEVLGGLSWVVNRLMPTLGTLVLLWALTARRRSEGPRSDVRTLPA